MSRSVTTDAVRSPRSPRWVDAVARILSFDGTRRSLRGTAAAQWVWPLVVVVLFCIPLFVGLGRSDLQNDEAIYSFAVDTMVRDGDWLTPKFIPSEHQAFLEKPPLKFWIVAAPIRLGLLPHSQFGLRFWDALFAGVAFLYVFAIGRRLAGPLCGAIAVLLLFLEERLVFDHGLRTNHMEAALVLCYCAGIYHFLAWRDAGSAGRRHGHVFALALYFVLGFMTKFVAALFLPMVLGAAVVLGGDFARLWRDRVTWLAAGMLALALISPWFIYQHYRVGRGFWGIILGQHVITRFTASLDPAHLQPWQFYFSEIFRQLQFTGATPLVLAGLALLLVRGMRRDATLILLWFALPVSLMSVGTSKLYHYAYPFLPALALAGGYVCAVAFDLGWSAMTRSWRPIQRVLADSANRAVRSPTVRFALLAAAALCIIVAVATYVAGGVRLCVGSLVLLRNATVIRPALIAMLMLVLAGRVVAAARIATVLLLALMLPSPQMYSRELTEFSSEEHPLQSLRDCLQPVCERVARSDGRAPGVWVANDQQTWPLCYYLRGLGPWEKQDSGPDAIAYMHLYAPGKLRPVILSFTRYQELMRRVRASDPLLIEEAARNAGEDPAILAARASTSLIVPLRFPDGVLLLPGPYAACTVAPHGSRVFLGF